MRILAASLIVAAATLIGCGGDAQPSGTATTGGAAAGTEAATGGGGAQLPGGGGAFCEAARQLDTQFDAAFEEGGVDFEDPAAVETLYLGIQQALHQLSELAPAEIADDVALSVQDYDRQIAAFEAVGWDLNSTEVAFEESSEATAASDRVEQYLEEACGITSG